MINNTLFKDLDERCMLILAPSGFRGHAVLRILASHPEVWWDSSIMNADGIPNYTSLNYPESNVWLDPSLKRQPEVNFVTAHTTMYIGKDREDIPLQHITDYYKMGNTLTTYLKLNIDLESSIHRSYIRLYASNLKQHFKQRWFWHKKDILFNIRKSDMSLPKQYNKDAIKVMKNPSDNPLAFNIDISNLFSDNEESFKTEYERIINHFNFTDNRFAVRSFILTYLQREQSMGIL
tara:strand:- start:641 stop:1345 length:705 start_codon:yes stop_codon:yes gene_type:complete